MKNTKLSAIENTASALEKYRADYDKSIPCKDAVRDIIKKVRAVLFPEYFECFCEKKGIFNELSEIHDDLSKQIASALKHDDPSATDDALREQAEDIATNFIAALPSLKTTLEKDVEAGYSGDPAAKSREDIIISYPGMLAVLVYRIAHLLYAAKVPLIPRMMTEYAHSRTGIDINAGAVIGEYFFIDHGTGVVIGETTVIGDRVKLYQGVTLGALSTRKGQALAGVKRHPTIENNVTVYSNSTILGGDTVIGEGSIIGGGAFITSSVPPHTKVIVKNQELIFKAGKGDVWEI